MAHVCWSHSTQTASTPEIIAEHERKATTSNSCKRAVTAGEVRRRRILLDSVEVLSGVQESGEVDADVEVDKWAGVWTRGTLTVRAQYNKGGSNSGLRRTVSIERGSRSGRSRAKNEEGKQKKEKKEGAPLPSTVPAVRPPP